MIWPLTAAELASLVGGELAGDPRATGERILTDSRSGVRAGDVFVGLQGPHFDGGRFAQAALEEGAALAIFSSPWEARPGPGQASIRVADPLRALQTLAAEARRRFPGTVLAITGSNGKTLVKDMLSAALGARFRVDASPRSYNSQIGVALSLLGMDPESETMIVECGISAPGEMGRLAAMVAPQVGIFTNVGDAHLEGLGDRQTVAKEKARLFDTVAGDGWVLTGEKESLAQQALKARGVLVRTVGPAGSGAEAVLDLDSRPPRLKACGCEVRLEVEAAAPFLLQDAALAATAALLLGAPPEAIEEGLRQWRPAAMRLEISTTPQGILLINDAYTADPVSVESALQALRRERSNGEAVAVLGGMAQLGPASASAHAKVGRRVVELGVDRLVGVGEGGRQIAVSALEAGMESARVHTVPSATEAAGILEEHLNPGDRVLLKASRPERLETIAATLFGSVSPARLYVDLDALMANYRSIRRLAGAERGVMAVVKSFGYGLDAVRVARALERAGIEYLAVAYPDEGVELRASGITTPILVQNLLEMEAEKTVRHGLTAQVSSREQADWLEAEAQAQRRAVR
ncbi:MAG: UDP-N-acetylmuramoyl-tripeptide--D-alanyl-D-alanine ligase, partial [Acidobacteria bacterium]|nr:UDP-N-acetylmuramoyl-tripeptide--D-alanyl-D-alanine ligase [Acidobacteriota bacterium]